MPGPPEEPVTIESTDSIVSDLLKNHDTTQPMGETQAPQPPQAPQEPQGETQEPQAPQEPQEPQEPQGEPQEPQAPQEPQEPQAPQAAPDPAKWSAATDALAAGRKEEAFRLMFGQDYQPTTKEWTAWRKATERERSKLTEERAQTVRELQGVQQQQQQFANTLRQEAERLKGLQVIAQAQERFRQTRDPSLLVQIIEGIAELPYDDAQKAILTGQRLPRVDSEARQELEQIKKELHDLKNEKATQQTQQTQQQAYAQELDYLGQHVEAGKTSGALPADIGSVPKLRERIHQVMVKSKGPLGPAYSPEQAALLVYRAEKARIESHPMVKGRLSTPAPATPAATPAATPVNQQPLRTESVTEGAPPNTDDWSTEQIIQDILRRGRAAKASGTP